MILHRCKRNGKKNIRKVDKQYKIKVLSCLRVQTAQRMFFLNEMFMGYPNGRERTCEPPKTPQNPQDPNLNTTPPLSQVSDTRPAHGCQNRSPPEDCPVLQLEVLTQDVECFVSLECL